MTRTVKSVGGANGTVGTVSVESVADILELELQTVIDEWLIRVEREPDLKHIPLSFEERTGHLSYLLHDVINRLRLDSGTKAPISKAAADHGDLRHKQGYTVAMAVGESRLLQVSIFYDAAQQRKTIGIQRAASRHCDDRGRGGCAVEGAAERVRASSILIED